MVVAKITTARARLTIIRIWELATIASFFRRVYFSGTACSSLLF